MAETSKIAWTDATINFWIGCAKVAQGCRNCYAEGFAKRVGADVWGQDKPRRLVIGAHQTAHKLERAFRKDPALRRRRAFVSSLSDFFDEATAPIVDHLGRAIYVADGGVRTATPTSHRLTVGHLRAEAWETMTTTAGVDFLILTKRPENVLGYWYDRGKPLDNIWLGISAATDAEYTNAIEWLHELRPLARYTFISAEPMVENITPRLDGFSRYHGPDWVIVGGESGHHARPCRVEWIRRFVEARRRSPNGARLFVKQLGSNCADRAGLTDEKGGDPEEWPADIRVREFPGVDDDSSSTQT